MHSWCESLLTATDAVIDWNVAIDVVLRSILINTVQHRGVVMVRGHLQRFVCLAHNFTFVLFVAQSVVQSN